MLLDLQPQMFKESPVVFVIVAGLSCCIIGLVFLIPWWLRCKGKRLTITNRQITYREGILSKSTSSVRHADIRNIAVMQGMVERMFGVGAIAISGAAENEIEVAMAGIQNPQKVKELIDGLRAA